MSTYRLTYETLLEGLKMATTGKGESLDGYISIDDETPKLYWLCVLADEFGKTRPGWMTSDGRFDGRHVEKLGKIVAWRKITNQEH